MGCRIFRYPTNRGGYELRKILLFDRNRAFCDDIESRMILDDFEQMDLITGSRFDHISSDLEQFKATELLINAELIPNHPDWQFGVPVKCYARNNEDLLLASKSGLPCYGMVSTAKELLKLVEDNQLLNLQKNEPHNASLDSHQTGNEIPVQQTNKNLQEKKALSQNNKGNADMIDVFSGQPICKNPEETKKKESGPDHFSESYHNYTAPQKLTPDLSESMEDKKMQGEPIAEESIPVPSANQSYQNPYHKPAMQETEIGQTFDIRSKLAENRAKEKEEEERRKAAQRRTDNEYAVEDLMGNIRHPAKVITVYSAKGGVGKTTIAAELATFLALTNHGRGRFQVCIVDFNIDFGDVLNTLSFDPEKSCMTYWAADIQSKLDMGQDPATIKYTSQQISVFLQRNEKDGLYALLAPLTNEDSMQSSFEDYQIERIIYRKNTKVPEISVIGSIQTSFQHDKMKKGEYSVISNIVLCNENGTWQIFSDHVSNVYQKGKMEAYKDRKDTLHDGLTYKGMVLDIFDFSDVEGYLTDYNYGDKEVQEVKESGLTVMD